MPFNHFNLSLGYRNDGFLISLDYWSDMNSEQIHPLVHLLYLGTKNGREKILVEHVLFRDPVAIVKGQSAVLSMFRKLNRLFSHAEIISCSPISDEEGESRWHLIIDYKGSESIEKARFGVFHTELILDYDTDGQIHRITEHWLKPLNMRGHGQNKIVLAVRRLIGFGLGMRL